jgi:GT2 family glycosyltransferase
VADHPVVPEVSIVVPTLGRELLRGCLESIADGTAWPSTLVVVDQGTDPRVGAWIDGLRDRGLRLNHLISRQTGIAAATNRGLEVVRTRFVATTHDDCRVRADWLERLSSRVRTIGDAILTGRVEAQGEGLVLTVQTSRQPATYTEPLLDRDVLFPPNMAFPLHLVDRLGYLDEHPSLRLAGEDNEWAYRALRAGVPIVYDPEVVVFHMAWQDLSRRAALYRRYARGQGSFYGKHLRRGDRFILRRAARDLARAPWLVLRGALTGNRELLDMGIGEVAGLPAGLLAGLRNPGAGSPDHSRSKSATRRNRP